MPRPVITSPQRKTVTSRSPLIFIQILLVQTGSRSVLRASCATASSTPGSRRDACLWHDHELLFAAQLGERRPRASSAHYAPVPISSGLLARERTGYADCPIRMTLRRPVAALGT